MKNNIIKNHALLRDIIALEPLDIKSVTISQKQWDLYRPTIKRLQHFGLWYDVSQYYNKLHIRVKVNEITEKFLQSVLDEIV